MGVEEKQKKDWRDFLPRGTKKRLAEKYGLTDCAVTYILRREDVLNYPDLIGEARKIALRSIKEARQHTKAIGNALAK